MADSTLAGLTAATAGTGGLYYGTQSGADRKFTMTAAGAVLAEAANAAAQVTALGVLPLSGGSLTAAVSVPTAANQTLASARINGFMIGASPATANEGISGFNNTLHTYAAGTLVSQINTVGFQLDSNVWLSWGSVAASSTQYTFLSGALAAATLTMGKVHATTATDQTIQAHGVTTGTGADLILKGGSGSVASGNVRFGTHATVGIELVTGYITIKDEGGTLRKLAVIS